MPITLKQIRAMNPKEAQEAYSLLQKEHPEIQGVSVFDLTAEKLLRLLEGFKVTLPSGDGGENGEG